MRWHAPPGNSTPKEPAITRMTGSSPETLATRGRRPSDRSARRSGSPGRHRGIVRAKRAELQLGSILGAMQLGVAVLASRRRAGMTAAPVIAPGLADLRMREP